MSDYPTVLAYAVAEAEATRWRHRVEATRLPSGRWVYGAYPLNFRVLARKKPTKPVIARPNSIT